MDEDRTLEPYRRGRNWWVRGTRPDTGEYIRQSLGTPDEAVAEALVEEIYREARKRRLLGPDAPKPEDELTFGACVLIYAAKPKEAVYLKPIMRRIGKDRVKAITPEYVRQLAKKMYPYDATDSWQRKVITPVRSVINNAHELGKCAPIRIRAFSRAERVAQDVARGKQSRVPREPGSWEWVLAFCEAATPRDAALAYFMFRHGYRIGQSITMTRSGDMDLSAGKVHVHASKGHPAHWVDLDPEEVVMIANIPVPYRGQARDRVFCISGGRSGALYRRWKATCKAAGITYLSPHAAGRHGYGTEMTVRQKVDPVSAADNLWSDPSVMLKTYAHPVDSAAVVREAFRVGKAAARTRQVQGKTGKRRKGMVSNAKS